MEICCIATQTIPVSKITSFFDFKRFVVRKRILPESDTTSYGQSLTHDNFNFFPYSLCSVFLEFLCLILHHIVSRKVSSDSFFNPIPCAHRESPLVKTGVRWPVTMAAATCLFIQISSFSSVLLPLWHSFISLHCVL